MSPTPQYEEQQLFRRISENDEQAFATIFHRYKLPILDYALKITKTNAAAEELVQETFLKLWAYRKKLADIENTAAYIHSITKNASLDYLRRLSNDRTLQKGMIDRVTTPGTNTTVEYLDRSETQRLIDEALDQLPTQQREVFRLSRTQGLNYAQIGEELGITSNTVKNHLVRALQNIREYLAKNHGGPVVLIIMTFLKK